MSKGTGQRLSEDKMFHERLNRYLKSPLVEKTVKTRVAKVVHEYKDDLDPLLEKAARVSGENWRKTFLGGLFYVAYRGLPGHGTFSRRDACRLIPIVGRKNHNPGHTTLECHKTLFRELACLLDAVFDCEANVASADVLNAATHFDGILSASGEKRFYVYVLIDADLKNAGLELDKCIFYVGKGTRGRMLMHEKEITDSLKVRRLKSLKSGYWSVQVATNLTTETALQFEGILGRHLHAVCGVPAPHWDGTVWEAGSPCLTNDHHLTKYQPKDKQESTFGSLLLEEAKSQAQKVCTTDHLRSHAQF